MIRSAGLLLLSWLCAAPLAAQEVTSGTVAILRGLDRLSGATTDLEVPVGGEVRFERLRIRVEGCRFPTANPNADAFAFLQVDDARNGQQLFRGWMIATAPALNALDDARFDVWVLACRTGPARAATAEEPARVEPSAPGTDAAVEEALSDLDPATLAPVSSIRPRPRPPN